MLGSPDFDSIRQTSMYGEEYWSARDLAPFLGYAQWRRFEEAIHRAMQACENSGNEVTSHFADTDKMVKLGSGAERSIKDYSLSRLACYLIAQNGDPRKPEIASAQLYFAMATRMQEVHQILRDQEKRLEMRLKVSESYKQLTETAQRSGVDQDSFGLFLDAGYLGLHHHTVERLKEKKNISEREDYLDNISREELAAIDFKNVLTEGKLNEEEVTDLDNAMMTHYFVGGEVRKTIEAVQRPVPEDLPAAPSIRNMLEEHHRARKRQLQEQKEKFRLKTRETKVLFHEDE